MWTCRYAFCLICAYVLYVRDVALYVSRSLVQIYIRASSSNLRGLANLAILLNRQVLWGFNSFTQESD